MDYAALQTAVSDWAARSDTATVAAVPSLIDMATAMFNHGQQQMVPLRTREMLTSATLTPTNGVVTLPADYLQFRSVVSNASFIRDLEYVAPDFANVQFADGAAGLSTSFTIVGNSLNVYPISGSDVLLSYYQKIPDLSGSNTSNWLLAKFPNIYLHASLLQLAMYVKDDNLFQRSAALITSMIDGLMTEELMANYARTGTRMRILTP
jgi:hypothetical protein